MPSNPETALTIPITADNIPMGRFWEADGSCWEYERDAHYEHGYRMKPMNMKAFVKGEPEGPMTDFYLPTEGQFSQRRIKNG
jgi:hypothetical protein